MANVITQFKNADIAEILEDTNNLPQIIINVSGEQYAELVGIEYDPETMGGNVIISFTAEKLDEFKAAIQEAVSAANTPSNPTPVSNNTPVSED